MDSEPEILKEVWESRICIEFNLAADPNDSDFAKKKSTPLYIDVPRFAYVPTFIGRLREHFLLDKNDDIWFEANNIPLRWHYPIGFLYDIYGENIAPWQLTVHAAPANPKKEIWTEVLRCIEEDTIKYHFKNMCKQAHYIQYGDIEAYHQLSIADSDQLWLGVRTNDKDRYFKMNESLQSDSSKLKNVAIRVHNNADRRFSSTYAVPLKDGESFTTLGQFLKQFIPDFFPAEASEATTLQLRQRVLIQGIRPPSLDMPLLWLMKNLSSAENFLYIVLQ